MSTPIRTHERIDRSLCGTPGALGDGSAEVKLTLTEAMRVDETGLVHGGFVFGLADHAAMLAVNEPTVVLGEGTLKFAAPSVVGDELLAVARVVTTDGKKRAVAVQVSCRGATVADGTFACVVPTRHVLRR